MSISGYKRLTIVFGVACVGLVVLCGSLFWSYGSLKIRVAFASEQTQIFDEMRTRALQGDAAEAADCLQYVVGYYPSGSKQETGSRLDRMVERERTLAARDIVAYLRAKTGEDLGESPEVWIQKYAKR
ncbi:MAG: hypothetical protein U0872_13145 [Planctomycetaceae bacterium]